MNGIGATLALEWSRRKLPAMVSRDLDLAEYADMSPNKVIAVSGFRRVGKTCSLLLLAQGLLKTQTREEVVYLNFEDERVPLRTETLTGLLPALGQANARPPRFLLLDEIQAVPDWSRWVRRVHDTEDIRLFVSGSSSKMSAAEIPTELRGRFLLVKMFPLSFPEFLRFRNVAIDRKALEHVADEKALLLRALDEYLRWGGLPEIVLADRERRVEIAQSYYQTVVRRDIVERSHIRNDEAMKALLRLLLSSTTYTVTKLHNTLRSLNYAVGNTTLHRYLASIEGSYFMFSLTAFSPSVRNELQHPRKAYFIDNIFTTVLSTRLSHSTGRLYENLVAVELLRRAARRPGVELHYWKNSLHEEVDFVVRNGTRVEQLIQVCSDLTDPDTRKRELRALLKAGRELRCSRLLVVNEDRDAVENVKGRRVVFTPLWKWLLGDRDCH